MTQRTSLQTRNLSFPHKYHQRVMKMNKLSNISAMVGFLIILSSYIVFSIHLEITKEKLNILYAVSGHVGISIIALVLCFNSNNKWLSAICAYVACFFILSTGFFIYVGIIENKSYFDDKMCILWSIPITLLFYVLPSYIIRKRNVRH